MPDGSHLDSDDVETSSLFGDGAAAVVVGASEGDSAVLASSFATDSAGVRLCEIRAGGTRFNISRPPTDDRDYHFRMQGLAVFRLAAERLPGFVDELLVAAGVERGDIDLVLDGASEAYLLLDEIAAAGVPVIVHPAMARASGERENPRGKTTASFCH